MPPEAHPERPGVVQRAFQIAKSGEVPDLPALMARLTAEGYPGCQQTLAGRSVSQQLTRMINEARGSR